MVFLSIFDISSANIDLFNMSTASQIFYWKLDFKQKLQLQIIKVICHSITVINSR